MLRTEDINLQQFIQYSSRIHGTEVVHILRIGETELARRGFPRGRRTFPSKLDGKRASKVHSMTGRPRCHGNGPPQTKSTPSGGRDGPRLRKEFPSSWRKPSSLPPPPLALGQRHEPLRIPLPATARPGINLWGACSRKLGISSLKIVASNRRGKFTSCDLGTSSANVKMLGGMFQVLGVGGGGVVEGDLVVVKGEKVVALEVLNWNCYVMG